MSDGWNTGSSGGGAVGPKGVSACSSRRSSFVMATQPLMLMSPEGVLHLVPAAQKPKKVFCEAHGLRVAYLNLHLNDD